MARMLNIGLDVTNLRMLIRIAAICFCLSTVMLTLARGQGASPAEAQTPAEKYFTDVMLVNQNGEKMRLYSDLLKDRVVVINSFFATCPGSCLPLSRNLQKIQEALGDRVGKEVRI